VEWYSTDAFSRFHGINEEFSPEWFAMLRKYADNMVGHRQNTFRIDMDVIGIQQLKDGSFSFDFTRFDQIAQVFWSTGKMDFMETGFLALRGLKGWRRKPKQVKKSLCREKKSSLLWFLLLNLISGRKVGSIKHGFISRTNLPYIMHCHGSIFPGLFTSTDRILSAWTLSKQLFC
jgi:hypothetical protein